MRSVRSTLGVAAMSLVAACASDSLPTTPTTTETTPVTVSFDRQGGGGGSDEESDHNHGHELRGSPNLNFARLRTGGGSGISFHGGAVLSGGTKVAAIYWAPTTIYNGGPTPGSTGAGSSDNSLVGYFMNHLGGSPYFNINTTYTNSAGTPIANIVNYTQYWANNTSAPVGSQTVTDAQMIAMLQAGFNSGMLTYDPNTLFAIFTAGTVNLGGGFGTQYCAYHTHGTVKINNVSKTVLYAAMPYNAGHASACSAGAAPNGDVGADAEVNTLAHEIEETTTDMMGNAWFDSRGYENADKCAWNFGTTFSAGGSVANIVVGGKNFLVQQNWVNSGSGGCVQHWP